MSAPVIELNPPTPERVAGSVLHGAVHVPDGWVQPGLSVTLTLTWYTEGKGERDVTESVLPLNMPLPPSRTIPFSIQLPYEPWSYHGVLLKIHWALVATVRVGPHVAQAVTPLFLRSPFLHSGGHPHRVAP